jgi:sterol desaturase/sphingolipid hydroxylase (fatty acid hydroxylase superfamily)
MVHFALAWCAFLAWAGATFTALERVWARHPARPAPRRIAAAAILLAVDGAIARVLVASSPDPQPVTRLVLAWLLAELLLYWVHRAMHRVPVLWRFHRLHHDGEPLAWATAWYVHPVDATLFATCAMLGGMLAGSGAPGAAWFIVGRRAWTVLLHANLAWPASVLDRFIATPPFHHRHHREDLAPANFASTLPVLDRLFGTAAGALQIGTSEPGPARLDPAGGDAIDVA